MKSSNKSTGGSCNCRAKARHDWFPMEAAAFLQSDTVAMCAPWEAQCYLHMLVLAWAGPGVSADPRVLSARLGLAEERVAELLDGPVGAQWTECCGKLWNDQLEERREASQAKRDDHNEKRSEAGKAGGKASGIARRKKAAKGTVKADSKQNERLRTIANEPERTRTNSNDREANEARGEEKRREEIEPLQGSPPNPPGGGSVAPRRVGGQALESVLGEVDFMDLPPEVSLEARKWAGDLAERGLPTMSRSQWRAQLKTAKDHPAAWLRFVSEKSRGGAQTLMDPTGRGLADAQAMTGTAPTIRGPAPQFLTARVAVQESNRESLDQFVAKRQHAASQAPYGGSLGEGGSPLELLGIESVEPHHRNPESKNLP